MSEAQSGLDRLYLALLNRFGKQNWWPIVIDGKSVYLEEMSSRPKTSDELFEIAVGAILTQNTAWKNVEAAIAQLKSHGTPDVGLIDSFSDEQLAELIKPSGYFNQKTKKLRALVKFIKQDCGGSLDRLRKDDLPTARSKLLGIWGVGRETADSALLYGLDMPIFLVDAYTRRILFRAGLIGDKDADYDTIREALEEALPCDVPYYRELHSLIVRLGNEVCKTKPNCAICPLESMCEANGIQTKAAI